MESQLHPGREPLHEVCVGIPGKEYHLEKRQADGPDARGATEPRDNLLGNNGLNEKEKKARQPNSQRVDQDAPLPRFLCVEALGQREPNMLLCAGQSAHCKSPHGLDGRDKSLHQGLGGRGPCGDTHPRLPDEPFWLEIFGAI